jgi:cystathionine beta-lyase
MKRRAINLRPGTVCVHAGTHIEEGTGGVNSPIFTSTAYAYPNPANENVYPRYFNVPNQRVISEKIAALEHAEDGIVFGSGMAAIATVLMAHLQAGDHAVFQADLYGGTHHLVTQELTRFGIEISLAGAADEFESAVRPATRVIYVESPSNPLLRCVDLAGIAKIARRRGVFTIIDNTFATPINQTPIDLGIDAVVHSGTKYLNGHSDGNSGVVVSRRDIIAKVRECAMDHGGMLDAFGCYQLERGLKTLAVRVRQHNENASRIAHFLREHQAVARVLYPGLADHPDHKLAAGQMRGFGGMLSFELRKADRVDTFLSRLRIATPALSLGGVETLVCVPSRTSHRTMSPKERQRVGINDGLIRVSVGIEDADDLIQDLDQALAGPKSDRAAARDRPRRRAMPSARMK